MDDNRKHTRCAIHWRSAIIVQDRGTEETIQCKTNDISANGVSVICHRNVAVRQALTVYLLVDPGGPSHPQVIVEARGQIMNNVLSGQQGGFRLGIQFTKFVGDGQKVLRSHLPKDAVHTKKMAAPRDVPLPKPAAPKPEEVPPVDVAPAIDGALATAGTPPEDEIPGQL